MEGIDDLLALLAGDADHTEVCLITQTKGVIFLVEVYIPDEFGWSALCDVSLFIHQHKTVLEVWCLFPVLIINIHSGQESGRLFHCPVIESQDGVCLAIGLIGPQPHLILHQLLMFCHQCLMR